MARNQLSRGPVLAGAIQLLGGDLVKRIDAGTVSINPASIAATSRGATAVTISGAAVGDRVVFSPPSGLEDDLLFVGAAVTGANTATVSLYNPTAGAIDGAALTWDYLWFDLT